METTLVIFLKIVIGILGNLNVNIKDPNEERKKKAILNQFEVLLKTILK